MDIVVFTGRMGVIEHKEDKPAEFQKHTQNGDPEKFFVEPYPAVVVHTVRASGWIALTVGSGIVLWIIYAMIFAYQ